jgi:hypothetical protein
MFTSFLLLTSCLLTILLTEVYNWNLDHEHLGRMARATAATLFL